MNFLIRFLQMCFAALLLPLAIFAQTSDTVQMPTPNAAGIYEVASSDLKKLDSSPKVEFPQELADSELRDKVVIRVTISPDGRVIKAKAVSGSIDLLKQIAEKTVRKWAFQPYLVNGVPVPVHTEISLNFDNTLDHYREANGDIPVHLDEKALRALIIKSPTPQYPPDARLARIQGRVLLRVIVGEDGRVHALHIISGHPMLIPPSYNAVRGWQFKPYVENGKSVPVDANLTIDFTIRG